MGYQRRVHGGFHQAIEIMQKILLVAAAICVAWACALSTTEAYYSDSACKTSIGSITQAFGGCNSNLEKFLVNKKLVTTKSTTFVKQSNPSNLNCGSTSGAITYKAWSNSGCTGATIQTGSLNVTDKTFNTCEKSSS